MLLFDGTAEGVPRAWCRADGFKWKPVDNIDDIDDTGWLLECDERGVWTLLLHSVVAATATQPASHPALVRVWRFTDTASIHFVHDPLWLKSSSEQRPIDIWDIGLEFFLFVPLSRVLWWRDPQTGAVYHSGAKSNGRDRRLGCRYCSLCGMSLSANNFISQHVRCCHPDIWALRLVGSVVEPSTMVANRGSEELDIFFEYANLGFY